jgi:hypothetical protein
MLLKKDITRRYNGRLQIGNANSTVTPSELEQAVEYFSGFFQISPKTKSILFGRYEPFFPPPQAAKKINTIVKYRKVLASTYNMPNNQFKSYLRFLKLGGGTRKRKTLKSRRKSKTLRTQKLRN